MSEVSGLITCPICEAEAKVKKNKNGKPGFYCPGCKVNVQSSGGRSQEFINANTRPVKSEADKPEEVKADGNMGQDNKSESGGERKAGGGLLSRFFGGEED